MTPAKMLFKTVCFLCGVLHFSVAATKDNFTNKQEPRFTNTVSKNVTVTSGQTAVLPCSVEFLGEYKIVWLDHRGKLLTFEDRRIISDERISLERPYVKEWNLHVRHVRPADTGTYMCQVNTNPVKYRPVVLHVQEPAKIIDHLSSSLNVVAKEGDMVELVCNVTGLPHPTVTWYRIPAGLMHDGTESEEKQIGVEGEVLVIHNVSRYCDDTYKCVAFNDVGPATNRQMRVYVEFPPEIRLPNRKLGQSRGKTTILECVVTAYPHAINVWRRYGKDIDRDSKYNIEVYDEDDNTLTLSLRIQSLSSDDYGEYECMSENQLGRDSETMTLYEYPKYEATTTSTTTVVTTKRTTTQRPGPKDNGWPDDPYPEFNSQSGSERWQDTGSRGRPDNLPQNNLDGYNNRGAGNSGWNEPGYNYKTGQNSVIAEPSRNTASSLTPTFGFGLTVIVCATASILTYFTLQVQVRSTPTNEEQRQ